MITKERKESKTRAHCNDERFRANLFVLAVKNTRDGTAYGEQEDKKKTVRGRSLTRSMHVNWQRSIAIKF